jgi:hypothetical protein
VRISLPVTFCCCVVLGSVQCTNRVLVVHWIGLGIDTSTGSDLGSGGFGVGAGQEEELNHRLPLQSCHFDVHSTFQQKIVSK